MFPIVAVLILLYNSRTCTINKHPERKVNENIH